MAEARDAKGLTPQMILGIVEDPEVDLNDLKEILETELNATFDLDDSREEIAKKVYEAFQARSRMVNQKRRESKAAKASTRSMIEAKDEPGSRVKKGTRSAYIAGVIKSNKTVTRADLEKAVDEAFNYSAAGKSPRTRVNRTVEALVASGKVSVEGSTIRWIGD